MEPVSEIRLLPATAEMVPPPQEPVNALGVETTSPAGKVSENCSASNVTMWFGFISVKLKVVDDPDPMFNSPNALLRFGGVATYTVAFEVFPMPPLVDVT